MRIQTCSCLVSWLAASVVCGQGTFIYDQQSINSDYVAGEADYSITKNQPIGQSFTPTLSSVDFVRFQLSDEKVGNATGATVYVNLWAGAIGTGNLLGSTSCVFMPDGFGQGPSPISAETNFFFPTPVSLTAGQTYYFQPVVKSGDMWDVTASYFGYSGGSLFVEGAANRMDLWFREGVYSVPEPFPIWLLLVGSTIFSFRTLRRRQVRRHSGR